MTWSDERSWNVQQGFRLQSWDEFATTLIKRRKTA